MEKIANERPVDAIAAAAASRQKIDAKASLIGEFAVAVLRQRGAIGGATRTHYARVRRLSTYTAVSEALEQFHSCGTARNM